MDLCEDRPIISSNFSDLEALGGHGSSKLVFIQLSKSVTKPLAGHNLQLSLSEELLPKKSSDLSFQRALTKVLKVSSH